MTHHSDFISILQLSDLHIMATPEDRLLGIDTEHYFHACIEHAFAAKRHFDLLLLTGDLAQDPCVAGYQRILTCLETYKTPCICLPGNHDDDELMQQVLTSGRVSCRKQVFLGNWQLISLNSRIPGKPGGRLSNGELDFLENCLIESPERHALVAVHHHCLATQSSWMDTMIIENRQAFLAVVNKYPQVKAITTGHIHQVMDIKTATLRVMGAPSTCFQFTPGTSEFSVSDTAPGYRLIELYADGRIESEVLRLPEPLVGLQPSKDGY